MDHDYRSPGFSNIDLKNAFPDRIVGDKTTHPWVYLRREVPHVWYIDQRNPLMGFLSSDEASALATLAALIPNADALEIGCHRGWSTAHLAQGVRHLDVIDPILQDQEHRADVAASLERAGVAQRCTLHAGTSPEMVSELARKRGKPWSVIFVDGDHEGEASVRDAAAVAPHAASDSIVIFHDLASPHVADGLAYMRSIGWNTIVFQTMQILGVAWRGNVTIPQHIPDPTVHWNLPDHLRSFRVSGEDDQACLQRLDRFFVDITSYDSEARSRAKIPLMPGTAVDQNLAAEVTRLYAQISASQQREQQYTSALSILNANLGAATRSHSELTTELNNMRNREKEWHETSQEDEKKHQEWRAYCVFLQEKIKVLTTKMERSSKGNHLPEEKLKQNQK